MSEEKNKSEEVSGNLKDATRQKYEQRIDELFNGSKPLRRNGVCVMQHSDMLDLLGYGDKPVHLAEVKVNATKHPLATADIWKKLPDWIDEPAMVFYSATEKDRLVFVAPELVQDKHFLIIVEPNGNEDGSIKAHLLLNAYERENFPPYKEWINKNLLIYADTKIVSRIDEKDWLQLPAVLKNPAFMPHSRIHSTSNGQVKTTAKRTKILTQKNLNGYRKQRQIELNQQIEQEKGNKMDEMKKQTVSGNLNDAVSWFDTQEQFQWSNGATNYYKREAQFIVDTVTKYPHRDGEPFVAISGSEYPALYPLNDKLDKVSIQAAEMILVKLDGQMDGYYKTNVEVFNHSGELLAERRYDLADRNGGLFNLLVEDERQIDNAVYLSQYLPQDEKMNLLDRIDKQMEVDNDYAMRYPEVKEARMATMSNRGAFFERLQQQILQQDKTVEQHLSEMVDEVVAIANRQNVEQRQPENEEKQNAVQTQELSGNLKAESTPLDALQALGKVEFITPALNKEQDALNETLQGLTAEQRKAVEPLYKQLEASHELRQMYQEYGDTIGVEDMEKHINRIEWAFRNKVKAFNEPQVDYSDMNYYKGVENTINKMREENEQRQPENEVSALSQKDTVIASEQSERGNPPTTENGENLSGSPEPKTETQPQVDEPKNFVQNQANSDKMPQNSVNHSISGIENASKSTQDLTSNLSHPETFQKQVLFAKVPETEVSKMIDEIAKSRTYLAVDFDNKDAAKAAGAKYDPQAKGWYAQDLTPELRQFLPQQPENITAERRPYTDLMANAQKIGVDLNNQNFKEEFDKWIRVPLQGKGARNTDGGYKLFRNEDGTIGGCVKNYSTNDTSVWNDRIQDGKQIQSKVPLPDYLANKRQQEWNTIAKHNATQQVYALRSETATAAYHQLQPALPDDPYIKNKGIAEIGKLKRLDDGSTIVPLYNNGKIANLQMIPSYDSKEKRMMTQAAKVGAYYSIGNTKTPSVVIVAEGVATADSVHQIASEIYGKDSVLTLSAVDSGNLPNVAAKVQHNFPNAQKIVAADNDALNATRAELKHKNAGLEKANEVKQAFTDFKVALCPALTDEKGVVKNTDWNDFLKANGKTESVKAFSQNEQYIAQHSVKQQAATPQTKQQNNNKGRSL
ncbi:MAG: hypothetical protein J5680_05580 [Neisseriaceae bacterium]|nr:hypothetical protein [Neisseriaceae bacterium]